ncbi:MAG: CHRD domain-containing protein [Acidimicrobiia bacterium]|nr:CHRD domain-containing protein [Acidimicrobiia bacterium]
MLRSVVFATTLALAASASVSAQPPQYRARLSVVPLDIPMQSTVAGVGSATATLKGGTLTVIGTFSGLKTPATVVRAHRSPKTGMRGAPIGNLTATPGTSGTISGSIELTKEQVEDLSAGRIYIQLHSEKAPDGNLWGWLLAAEKNAEKK